MTVAELKERLAGVPDHLEVVVEAQGDCGEEATLAIAANVNPGSIQGGLSHHSFFVVEGGYLPVKVRHL